MKNDLLPSEKSHPKPWVLRNGNQPYDLSQAKRCGAKSKRSGKPCQQPAMNNGRCRLHGGKSTGPKTEAGREQQLASAQKHGFYTAEAIAERKAIRAFMREAQENYQ